MSTTFGAFGTVSHGTDSCTPAYPATTAGQGIILAAFWANDPMTEPGNITGWTKLGTSLSGASAALGVDAGKRNVTLYKRDADADGTETGNVTVSQGSTVGTNRVISAIIYTVNKTETYWQLGFAGGNNGATAADPYAVTVTPPADWPTLDGDGLMMLNAAWVPDNTAQVAGTFTWTGSGAAGSTTGHTGGATTTGGDQRWFLQSEPLTGSGTGDMTHTVDPAGAVVGATAFLLIGDTNTPPAGSGFTGWGVPL